MKKKSQTKKNSLLCYALLMVYKCYNTNRSFQALPFNEQTIHIYDNTLKRLLYKNFSVPVVWNIELDLKNS